MQLTSETVTQVILLANAARAQGHESVAEAAAAALLAHLYDQVRADFGEQPVRVEAAEPPSISISDIENRYRLVFCGNEAYHSEGGEMRPVVLQMPPTAFKPPWLIFAQICGSDPLSSDFHEAAAAVLPTYGTKPVDDEARLMLAKIASVLGVDILDMAIMADHRLACVDHSLFRPIIGNNVVPLRTAA